MKNKFDIISQVSIYLFLFGGWVYGVAFGGAGIVLLTLLWAIYFSINLILHIIREDKK